jgi:hypothetical protein
LSQALHVFNPFGEQQRRAAFANGGQYIGANHFVPRVFTSQRLAEPVKFHARIILRVFHGAKCGWTYNHPVNEESGRGLLFRINAMPYRAALHEDDRVMAVFAISPDISS